MWCRRDIAQLFCLALCLCCPMLYKVRTFNRSFAKPCPWQAEWKDSSDSLQSTEKDSSDQSVGWNDLWKKPTTLFSYMEGFFFFSLRGQHPRNLELCERGDPFALTEQQRECHCCFEQMCCLRKGYGDLFTLPLTRQSLIFRVHLPLLTF